MKKILGLDLGTNSIGWAVVNEAENESETSGIVKLGVRVNPLTVDEKTNFEKGKPISTNADRTLKRGMRRNLQRFKLRRKNLIQILKKGNIIGKSTLLAEHGKHTTFETLAFRSRAASEKIELEALARVLLAINKKRGYKSNRKAKDTDEGQAIDGMAIAKKLYDDKLTPGQYVYGLLQKVGKYIPDFYRSDLQAEFDKIWAFQKQFYSNILTTELYNELKGKSAKATWAICKEPFNVVGIPLKGKRDEVRLEKYKLRVDALSHQLNLEHLAIVLQEINNNLNKSSGYLGAISDRSKELYFNKQTVGQNLYAQIQKNPHTRLKNQVFYRQDYLDEFEKIWETQQEFHPQLTPALKEEIRDAVIFYQRKLRSQKGLLSFCQFESWEQKYVEEATGKSKTRTVGQRVIAKSSPLFQEFKIWQTLNNLTFKNKNSKEKIEVAKLDKEIRQALFEELNLRGDLAPKALMAVLAKHRWTGNISEWECEYKKIEGNHTNQALYDAYRQIAENEGYGFDWEKKTAPQIKEELKSIFPEIGIDTNILNFDANAEKDAFDKQPGYQLWHLLYSAEDDDKISEEDKLTYGNSDVALKKKLHQKYGFKPQYAGWLANFSLQQDDYGNLSARAIRKIMPFLQDGHVYSEACESAGYNHSNSLTKEELAQRELKPRLEILKKNSLRNPVVEKILNQMVNVVNQVIDTYGKPDEVRIELARELKKSAKEREDMTKHINKATRNNEEIKKIIQKDFGFTATKNDVVRYKLYEELCKNGYKTLFTNRCIPKEKLFSKEIDIEHIIPKALLFDDSYSNKTLAYREVNLKKSDRTALDFITQDHSSDLENYKNRVESLYKAKAISKGKYNKLLMSADKLPEDFIARDLRNSQYIAKQAKQMLFKVFPTVVATSGSITDKLREDWGLINVMKDLNLPKYRALGLTETEERKEGKKVEIIKDWTKRNDHRHHAMDALTVAFTSHNHIQYINNLNASRNKESELYGIRNKITQIYEDVKGNKKRKFIPPVENFRQEAKKHIESILISFKTKNKVVTQNVNKVRLNGKGKYHKKIQLTPRGQLHNETIYGQSKRPMDKPVRLSAKFTPEQAHLIINVQQKALVLAHLAKFENKPGVAFDPKTLKKQPLLYEGEPLKEVLCYKKIYTIRKDISPDLKIEKVVDERIKGILERRLSEFGNDKKKAFSDLDKNPIRLNQEKGIAIKRVTIKGVNNAEPLHYKKDHSGNEISDENGQKQPIDFVNTGNNHHIAIYRDEKGNLQEQAVSFYEAVARVSAELSVIDKQYKADEGWQFLFTMKQNEMFVFPSEDFDPQEIDLLDEKNTSLISRHLFRVQKLSSKYYVFRHHLETNVNDMNELRNKAWKREGLNGIEGILKVRVNHLGKIIQTGEY